MAVVAEVAPMFVAALVDAAAVDPPEARRPDVEADVCDTLEPDFFLKLESATYMKTRTKAAVNVFWKSRKQIAWMNGSTVLRTRAIRM